MADKKPPSSGGGNDNYRLDLIAFLLFLSALFGYFHSKYIEYIVYRNLDISLSSILQYLNALTLPIRFASFALSGFLFIGILVLSFKIGKILNKATKVPYLESSADEEEIVKIANKKWERVIAHLESANPSDWKLAILEADIILGEMLEKMNYKGESIGEKLKGIEKSDFESLDLAWQAHKIRNDIAHKGYDYSISREETISVIEMYKKVFEEFHFI